MGAPHCMLGGDSAGHHTTYRLLGVLVMGLASVKTSPPLYSRCIYFAYAHVCLCVCMHHVHETSEEAGRGCQIPRNWR